MGRGKHGTDVFRGQVQAFRVLGLNNSEIVRRLGCSREKVINAINLFNDTGSLSNKKRKSRERKTPQRRRSHCHIFLLGHQKLKNKLLKI